MHAIQFDTICVWRRQGHLNIFTCLRIPVPLVAGGVRGDLLQVGVCIQAPLAKLTTKT